LRGRIVALRRAHLALSADEILHVMSDFVREHICLREVAGCAELSVELIEEAEVEIDLAIARAVERTARGFGTTTCGANFIAKEDELRGRVVVNESLLNVLRTVEHGRHQIYKRIFVHAARCRRTLP